MKIGLNSSHGAFFSFILQVKLKRNPSISLKYLASQFFCSPLKDIMVFFLVNSYAGALRYFLTYDLKMTKNSEEKSLNMFSAACFTETAKIVNAYGESESEMSHIYTSTLESSEGQEISSLKVLGHKIKLK